MNQSYRFRDRQHNGHETLDDVRIVGAVRLTKAQLAVVIGAKHIQMLPFLGVATQHHSVRMAQRDLADMLRCTQNIQVV